MLGQELDSRLRGNERSSTNGPSRSRRGAFRLQHEPIKEPGELRIRIERQNMRDELVRPHDHHAAVLAIDAAHGEDVMSALQVGAEHLFVIAQTVAAFPRQEKVRHSLDRNLAVPLLKHRTQIDE